MSALQRHVSLKLLSVLWPDYEIYLIICRPTIALGTTERRAIEPRLILRLDENIFRAIYKDIVQGTAAETDCVFKLRGKVRDLAEDMVRLAGKQPSSLLESGDDQAKEEL